MPWGTIEERHDALLDRSISLKRGTSIVGPITARLVSLEQPMVRTSGPEEGGRSPQATAILVTTDDADIKRDDMFRLEGQTYVVLDVTPASMNRAGTAFRKRAYLKVQE